MSTHKPATPLPWYSRRSQVWTHIKGPMWQYIAEHVRATEDGVYLVHTANAYPRLVEALRCALQWDAMLYERFGDRYPLDMRPAPNVRAGDARTILRELGELP